MGHIYTEFDPNSRVSVETRRESFWLRSESCPVYTGDYGVEFGYDDLPAILAGIQTVMSSRVYHQWLETHPVAS